MILIFCDGKRGTTDRIASKLKERKIKCLCFTGIIVDSFKIKFDGEFESIEFDKPFNIKIELIDLGVNAIYFDSPVELKINCKNEDIANSSFGRFVNADAQRIAEYVVFVLEGFNKLGRLNADKRYGNKLINLNIAQEKGFNVPPSLITSSKNNLEEFISTKGEIITKTISYPCTLVKDGYLVLKDVGTVSVSFDMLETLNEEYCFGLFQKKLVANYELRVLFIDGLIIVAQLMAYKEGLDIRKLMNTQSIKISPYALSLSLEDKIRMYFKTIDLNFGSIDLLVDKNGEVFFLEMNPTGQFGWMSVWCGHSIEDIIVNKLISYA